MFRIKKLVVIGKDSEGRELRPEISFGKKLTIIYGPGNCGKTHIFNCINYVLGKNWKNHLNPPFGLRSHPYTDVQLILETQFGDMVLTRKIGTNMVQVETTSSKIASGSYYIDRDSKKEDALVLSDLLAQLIGAPIKLRIPKNQEGITNLFSWQVLKNVFMFSEKYTETEQSIFLSSVDAAETFYLGHLLYYLYDFDFSSYYNDAEDKRIRKAKNEAIKLFAEDRVKSLEQRIVDLKAMLQTLGFKEDSNDDLIRNVRAELANLQAQMAQSGEESKRIVEKIQIEEQRLQELLLSKRSNDELKSDLEADIERLTFIVQAKGHVHDRSATSRCPVCSGEITIKDTKSIVEAARVELEKTINTLNQLTPVQEDIDDMIAKCREEIAKLKADLKQVTVVLEEALRPTFEAYSRDLADFERCLQIQTELAEIKKQQADFQREFEERSKGEVVENPISFVPRDLFRDDFASEMSRIYKEILTKIGGDANAEVAFDLKTFDVEINGVNKTLGEGKGRRTIINSIMLLAMREYASSVETKHSAGFYIIDSPVHDYQMPDFIKNTSGDVRKNFFEYVYKNLGNDQFILMENIQDGELEGITADGENVVIYQFTKNPNEGRYGFLDEIR